MSRIFIVIGNDYKFEGAYTTLEKAYDFVNRYFDSDNFCEWEIQEQVELQNGSYATTEIYDYSNIGDYIDIK